MKRILIFINYRCLNGADLLDEESRKILEHKIEETRQKYEKSISDHLKYEKNLIQQMVKLK